MKVKVSKVMRKEIFNYLKNQGDKYNGYGVYYCEMTPEQFNYCVDYHGADSHLEDYDYKTNKMKVITITYPHEYYACARYLTTQDLTHIFNNSDHTLNGFMKRLEGEIEC